MQALIMSPELFQSLIDDGFELIAEEARKVNAAYLDFAEYEWIEVPHLGYVSLILARIPDGLPVKVTRLNTGEWYMKVDRDERRESSRDKGTVSVLRERGRSNPGPAKVVRGRGTLAYLSSLWQRGAKDPVP